MQDRTKLSDSTPLSRLAEIERVLKTVRPSEINGRWAHPALKEALEGWRTALAAQAKAEARNADWIERGFVHQDGVFEARRRAAANLERAERAEAQVKYASDWRERAVKLEKERDAARAERGEAQRRTLEMQDLWRSNREGRVKAEAESARLRKALDWACGAAPNPEGKWFEPPAGKHPPYWWRTEMRRIAGDGGKGGAKTPFPDRMESNPAPASKPASGQFVKKPIPVKAVQQSAPFEVKTLEGTMKGADGDWLITGPKGEQWPIKDAIFQETYEPAPPPAAGAQPTREEMPSLCRLATCPQQAEGHHLAHAPPCAHCEAGDHRTCWERKSGCCCPRGGSSP